MTSDEFIKEIETQIINLSKKHITSIYLMNEPISDSYIRILKTHMKNHHPKYYVETRKCKTGNNWDIIISWELSDAIL